MPTFCSFPFIPRSFDLWTIDKVAALVEGALAVNPQLQAYIFLNRTDPQGQGTDNEEAADHLRTIPSLTYIDAPLGSRRALAHAASQGLAVTELQGKHHNAKAVEEMMILYRRCLNTNITSLKTMKAAG